MINSLLILMLPYSKPQNEKYELLDIMPLTSSI